MFSSLRYRLWLSYAFLIVTALGVVAMILFIYLIRNPILYRQTLERLRVIQTIVGMRENLQQARSLSSAAERASREFDVRILLYSEDQQVLMDTYSGAKPALPFPGRRLLLRSTPVTRDADGAAWLYTLDLLPDHTYLVVAIPRPRVSILTVFTEDFLPLILQSGLIALACSLVIAFLVARWIADPLERVVKAARAMPSAEIEPVDPHGPQEVQELMRAFNAMVARVRISQQSQRDFVANVSHELKTPLTSIQGFSQAILDGTAGTPDERKQAAQVIYDESARMHRMVLDLLDLARIDAGTAEITMTPVDIAILLNAIVDKFKPQSQAVGVEIVSDLQNNLPKISGDGDRLLQVITNFVDNSLKFTPRGGIVTLHAEVLKDEILISVTDTGTGISDQAREHIFDRFYQADTARKGGKRHGAGLGLAIAREIVLAHGGRISVRSRLGEGTTFEVFLPIPHALKSTGLRKK